MQLKILFNNDYLRWSQAIKKVPSLICNWNANPTVPDLPQSLKENGRIFPKNLGKTSSFHTPLSILPFNPTVWDAESIIKETINRV
jgi:hypothetical protein